jgi:pyruvate kinase
VVRSRLFGVTRRAKIVCTIGPATATPEGVRALVESGMDVARLNFGRGSHAEHERAYRMVRQASDATGHSVGVLADLRGRKIRLGRFTAGAVEWHAGERVTITPVDVPGTHDRVPSSYPLLAGDVRPGDRLLVDDGNVALVVRAVDGGDVCCDVAEGGPISAGTRLPLPGVSLSAPALSDKDAADLRFALGLRVDVVALSSVRSPEDVRPVHKVMDEQGCRLPVLAKLATPEAVANLDAVAAAFDGAIVARGDLGVEMPLEQVPLVQKRAVQVCREHAKPVIVATQMLESMIERFRPTRAEASDVANAVLDGADALMLGGETSIGRYPVQAVSTMARIIDRVDGAGPAVPVLRERPETNAGALVKAAMQIGEVLGAAALAAFTQTGDTVRRLARHHPSIPVLAFTPEPSVRSQLALSWGVETFIVPTVQHTDEMIGQVDSTMLEHGRGRPGELVVIVAGSPPATPRSTNLIRLHRLGDPHSHG